ncbi:O-antigen ligase family protein [Parapusillimonas sp. SGNA-6]|nr:O-antigen ligase family protein [Parapusillimonas sp. SGNA-6]
MLIGLQIYYLAASTLLFLYAIYSNHNAVHAFGYGIALNIFPLMFMPYVSMNIARMAGIPLAYLPVIAAGLALAVRNRMRVPRRYGLLLGLTVLYCIYAFVTTVLIGGTTFSNFAYWLAWPLNFVVFFSAVSFFSKVDRVVANKVIKSTAMILVAGCLVGLARLASGIEADANFMPAVNRNGTVVFTVMICPLLFYIFEDERKSRTWLLFCLGAVFLALVSIYSRSGLIGLVLGVVLYFLRFTLGGLIKSMAAIMVIIVFISSGVAEKSLHRLEGTSNTINMVLRGDQLDQHTMGDYARVALLTGAIETAKEHFWFGTGLGLENYREGLRKASNYDRLSKAHNFYVSYFAELGVVGFSILLAILYLIWRSLLPLSSRYRAFRVSYIVIAVMMAMNEYILLPELWFFFGMLAGMSYSSMNGMAVLPAVHAATHPLRYVQPAFNRIDNRMTRG